MHSTFLAIVHAALRSLPLCLAAWALAWGPAGEPRPGLPGTATASAGAQGKPPAASAVPARPLPRTAQFGRETASASVRHIARWVFDSGDHGERGVVLVDKQQAKVFVFGPDGTLRGATPALLGSAIGDHTVPGIGNKPIAQVLPAERTTPAGRFVAEPGTNASGEDVVWVDYDAAVSMHRVRATVKAERRLERLASTTPRDNRISYGCINLPVAFYDNVLSPLVRSTGAVIYVLPETQPVNAVFAGSGVPAAEAHAFRQGRARRDG